jgi:outer membrane protein assembly factor BamB/HEAT repeat protein
MTGRPNDRAGCLAAALFVVVGMCSTRVFADGGEKGFSGGTPKNWESWLSSKDRQVRRRAQKRLLEAGTSAIPMLDALIRGAKKPVREECVEIASRIGKPIVATAVRMLHDLDPWTRFHGVCILRNVGSDAAHAVPDITRMLFDKSAAVAMESARALAIMGVKAESAVPVLAGALSHRDRIVRTTVAGALAAIGPKSEIATPYLIEALKDVEPGVRRAAADALQAIGPGAVAAVKQLRRSLRDKNLYARISAVGALGGIGEAARPALKALRSAANEPALRSEVAWAVRQISGEDLPAAVGSSKAIDVGGEIRSRAPEDAWPMLGGAPTRNAISPATGLPSTWDLRKRRNVLWSERLGDESYGTPIVSGGKVFVGTGNENPRDPRVKRPCGILMAFRASDGKLLWQDDAAPLGRGIDDFLLQTTTSSPLVEGDRLWYLTAQCQLRCLDTEGFLDGENDGPFTKEKRKKKRNADQIWELDIGAALGVFPHEAPNCSVVSVGDLLMVCTANGVDEAHANIPAPRAPSFIGVDKRSGAVVWRVIGPSPRVLHGQWSSPAIARINGRILAFFGGGDGWLYALEAETGREIWRYDGNPKNAVWLVSGDVRGKTLRNNIIACPVYVDGMVFLALGQDPNHGRGKGRLHAIDPGGNGDVTGARRIWERSDIGRLICSPAAIDGLLYVADYDGIVHCLESKTGKTVWTHDLFAGVWGGLLIADGKLYVGDEDGALTVFALGREKKVLGAMSMRSAIWSAPSAADGVLYVATSHEIFALAQLD